MRIFMALMNGYESVSRITSRLPPGLVKPSRTGPPHVPRITAQALALRSPDFSVL